MSGARIIKSIEDAARGDFARVTVMGQTWVRLDHIKTIEDHIREICRSEMVRCNVLADRSDNA